VPPGGMLCAPLPGRAEGGGSRAGGDGQQSMGRVFLRRKIPVDLTGNDSTCGEVLHQPASERAVKTSQGQKSLVPVFLTRKGVW